MTVIHYLADSYRRRRFACLFVSLIVTLVVAPLFSAMGVSTRFMEVFLGINILAVVVVTLADVKTYLGFGLLILVVIARGGHALMGYGPLLATSQGVCAVICLLSVCVMLRFVLSQGLITSERIFAALAAYLLGGIMCGLIFGIFEEQWPGSFSSQGSPLVGGKENILAHTIYFSFVTLGTLGYGDFIPISGPARALAVLEAIGGQMYLVVIVARLVSLYEGQAARSSRNELDETTRTDEISRW